jgi:mRNA export factor
MEHKVYAMDCKFPFLAVATSDRTVSIYNLAGQVAPFKVTSTGHMSYRCGQAYSRIGLSLVQQSIQSQIKSYQTRCIAMFPDKSGFALGNIEGRVAIHYIDRRQGE